MSISASHYVRRFLLFCWRCWREQEGTLSGKNGNSRECAGDSVAPTNHRALTKEGVGEAVPPAAVLSNEPAAAQAGGEAEGGPEDAHEHVAHADVQQDEVDGGPQGAKLREGEQSQDVVHDPRDQNEAEENRHHGVTRPAQPAGAPGLRGVPEGAERAVRGARIATACEEHHSSERRGE